LDVNYRFESEAENDLFESFYYYENKDPGIGLGDRFIKNVKEKANKLSQKPNAYSVVYKSFRKAPLSKFPFNIYYMIKEPHISIIAVLHKKRKADIFTKRADNQDKSL
jgi:plasmid stabilization system protein ParE